MASRPRMVRALLTKKIPNVDIDFIVAEGQHQYDVIILSTGFHPVRYNDSPIEIDYL